LFQYAAAFGVANHLRTELILPIESETYNTAGRYNPVIGTYDSYSNDLFKLFDLQFVKKLPLAEIQQKVKHRYTELPVVKYHSDVWTVPNDTNLHGYFQAIEYLLPFENLLREELTFTSQFYEYGLNYLNPHRSKYNRIVSVHIRRGDSLPDNAQFNVALSKEYYMGALQKHTTSEDLILVLSDDIDWCRQNFTGKNYQYIDNRDRVDSHLYDFILMSMCDVNIIATSTYSWWAGWLQPLGGKKVIMPSKWWGPALAHNSEEAYRCSDWIINEVI
jgi:hypothetical protein